MFLAAAALSTATFTAAVDAAPGIAFDFRIAQQAGDRIQGDFRRVGHEGSQWNSSFSPADFAGLDTARLAGPAEAPVQFSLVRDAGRLDCQGVGGRGVATGRCQFSADRAFADYLQANGIPSPSTEDSYTMTAVGVRRDLVAAIRQASYPAPSATDLVSLAALGVERSYVDGLAAAGYRPDRIDTLIQYKALGITPAYIAGLRRAGFERLTPSEIIQFKALGIDHAYVESLRAVGYGNLAAGTLVEFKALGVTADYLAGVRRHGLAPAPGKIVQMKALGITADDLIATGDARR